MKDNYSWLDSFLEEFRLDVIDHFNEGGGNLQQTKTDAKQTIISQIEIEKLRAEIGRLDNVKANLFNADDEVGAEVVQKHLDYLQEKLKELEG
jgi:hypothetical protein